VNTQVEASALYESVMRNVGDGKLEAAEDAAAQLYADYDSTTYPGQARLAMARLYMDRGRDEDAANTLRGVLDSSAGSQVKTIGRLRLARVLLYQGKPQDVVDLLDGEIAEAFVARYNDVLGDAYVDLERYDDAADAYEIAMSDNRQAPTVDLTLVQMKINDLPEEGEVTAVDETLTTSTEEDEAGESTDESAAEPEDAQ
jgi:predicted negative regulator of RcsB-dependent stress response